VRAVLDTNVVCSALLWGGIPERLIELAGDGGLELFTSEPLLAELSGILVRSKFARKLGEKSLSATEILASYRLIAETIQVAPLDEPRLRDSDDVHVLACAVAARADVIVSGDADLQALGIYRGIAVLSPADCLRRISA